MIAGRARALTEWESKHLLGPTLPTPAERLTRSSAEAAAFARECGVPVVAKASGVPHKSDVGLVRLGLDDAALEACWSELAESGDGTVLVAVQVDGGTNGAVELIIGGVHDDSFGPVVSVGLGGIAAEVLDDVAVMLAPPEPGELDAALERLRGARLLDGHRGGVPLDRSALAVVVQAVADLLARPDVVEVDCNPVMVRADGTPVVVDALVVVRS